MGKPGKLSWLDGQGIGDQFPAATRDFSLLQSIKTGFGTHKTSYPIAFRALSWKVKQPGHEADHSLPFSAMDKNVWSYTSTVPHVFIPVLFIN
jgi:hypothetical protein